MRVFSGTPSWTGERTRTHFVPFRTALLSHACASVRIACARVCAVLEGVFPRFGRGRARGFGKIAHAKKTWPQGQGLAPGELSVWRPGEEPFTARGWREALALLEEVAHAAR